MGNIALKIIMEVLTVLPNVAGDIANGIKEAESTDDAKAKAKGILLDVSKIIGGLTNML